MKLTDKTQSKILLTISIFFVILGASGILYAIEFLTNKLN